MRFVAFLALALVGCASDPWVGDYDGTATITGVDCATGASAPDSPHTQSSSPTIMRSSDNRLFFSSSSCPVFATEVSDAYATVDPRSCDVTLSSGTPVHYTIVSGAINRASRHIDIEYSVRGETPSSCVIAHVEISADRL